MAAQALLWVRDDCIEAGDCPRGYNIFFLLLGAEFCRKKKALVQVRDWHLPPGDAGGFCASLLDTLTHLPPFPAASQHRMDF